MSAGNLLIQCRRIPSDQLTPVLAYRRLVAPDDRNAPSFLLESVEQGGSVGRYSMLGARPVQEVVAKETTVEIFRDGKSEKRFECPDPLQVPRDIAAAWKPFSKGALPDAFHGGWVGFLSFDAVRWLEPKALSFHNAPKDDRNLPDMHMGLYRQVVVFDHFTRTLDCVVAQSLDEHGSESAAQASADIALEQLKADLLQQRPALATGEIQMDLHSQPKHPARSSMTRAEFESAVVKAKQAIADGDAFQIVLSQRLERETNIDPFELYRALRIVNPSPYQVYLRLLAVFWRPQARKFCVECAIELWSIVHLLERARVAQRRNLTRNLKQNCWPTRRSARSMSCWWTLAATILPACARQARFTLTAAWMLSATAM